MTGADTPPKVTGRFTFESDGFRRTWSPPMAEGLTHLITAGHEHTLMTENRERNQLAMHLGETLREARKRAELTQLDVAERVELATEVLGRIERGHMLPSVPTLRKLCRTLHLDANAMLGLDPENTPAWPETPDPEVEELPELRRLMRALRRMDAAQLSVVISTANALLRYTGQRPEDASE